MIRPYNYARGDIKHLTISYGGASPQGEVKSNDILFALDIDAHTIICHIERNVVKSKYLM